MVEALATGSGVKGESHCKGKEDGVPVKNF